MGMVLRMKIKGSEENNVSGFRFKVKGSITNGQVIIVCDIQTMTIIFHFYFFSFFSTLFISNNSVSRIISLLRCSHIFNALPTVVSMEKLKSKLSDGGSVLYLPVFEIP